MQCYYSISNSSCDREGVIGWVLVLWVENGMQAEAEERLEEAAAAAGGGGVVNSKKAKRGSFDLAVASSSSLLLALPTCPPPIVRPMEMNSLQISQLKI